MNRTALIVLKPRQIAVTDAAIEELRGFLPIVQLIGYTEAELEAGAFTEGLETARADFYLVASDDLIVRRPAIAAVTDILDADRAATGYCQFSHTDWRVNITRRPLSTDLPVENAYSFLSFHEVVCKPPSFQTWFTGMSLTAMSREMWQQFPFGCFKDQPEDRGYASDFHLSRRLQNAGIPIICARDAFTYHWRYEQRHTNDPRDDRVLTGDIPKDIRVL